MLMVCSGNGTLPLAPSDDREHEDDVAQEFADGGPEDDAPHVGTQDAEGNGDGGAEDGKEREGGNPRTTLLHIVTGGAQTTFLDVHPVGNLFNAADTSNKIVEQGTQHVSDGAAENGEDGIHACGGQQRAHDDL